VRTMMALVGCVVLACVGCTTTPPPPVSVGPATEFTPLALTFEETQADVEGAKRVAVCQLRDERTNKDYAGSGPVGGNAWAVSKYRMKDDPTLVVPRMLAKELKGAGFNVTPAERVTDLVGGDAVTAIAKRTGADYVIAGRLEEMTVHITGGEAFITVSARLDIFNQYGELRAFYPARASEAEMLGERAGDPAEVEAALQRVVNKMLTATIEDAYFDSALDLDAETVKKMREAKPLAPAAGAATPSMSVDVAAELDAAQKGAAK
jgi:hypothetical protein